MSLYQNKYRIETARSKEWDYSNPWWYYVTINTKNHHSYFGRVIKGNMILNYKGGIAEKIWKNIPEHYGNVELDHHVIMPNHIHGIIIINEVETGHAPSLQRRKNTLSNIVGSFKSAVTKTLHERGIKDFAWQPRFYDRIIRNEKELYNIRKYIEENPLKWYYEKDNPENIFESLIY